VYISEVEIVTPTLPHRTP